MFRLFLTTAVAALVPAIALAQKPRGLDFDSLGKLVSGTGLKAETGQGVFKVTLPGEDGWFIEVWLSKSAPIVLATFPCQSLPPGKVEQSSLLKVLAQNGRMDGAYFGYNEKTKNFYLESTLSSEGLTPAKLRAELERLQKLAIATSDLWDTSRWPVEKR